MIISHKYRFIFIKTIKTAGTSIEVFLSPHCGPQDVLTPVLPVEPGHEPRNWGNFYNHCSAWRIRAAVPVETWNSYFTFCVERNPWDKTVSDYCMQRYRSGGSLGFADYLQRGRFCRSWGLYTERDGHSLLVDRILRYERLDEELGEVFGKLGVPWPGRLEVHAKSDYRTDRRHYREWYTDEQRNLVTRAFADEIREFGYAF